MRFPMNPKQFPGPIARPDQYSDRPSHAQKGTTVPYLCLIQICHRLADSAHGKRTGQHGLLPQLRSDCHPWAHAHILLLISTARLSKSVWGLCGEPVSDSARDGAERGMGAGREVVPVARVSGAECLPLMTSRSGMTSAGEKKCIPSVFSGLQAGCKS
eukprot:2627554-Rhodomonas_salina.2